MSNEQELTPEQKELATLQTQLEEAKKLQATLLQAKADKAALALLEARHKAEAEEERKRQEHERKVAEVLAKRKAAEEAEAAKKASEAADIARLERESEQAQEALRRKSKHDAEVKALQERLFNEEQENLRIARDLQDKVQGPKVETAPVTLSSPSHPLSRLFGSGEEVAVQPQEIDSQALALQNSKSQVTPAQPQRKAQRFIDIGTSRELEALIRTSVGISPNTQKCDELSAVWEYEPLISATRSTIAYAKVRPLGHDQFFTYLESTLENPTPAPQTTLATPEQIAEQVSKAQSQNQEAVESGAVGGANA